MPKALIHIAFLITMLFSLHGFGQPPINERYVIDDESHSVFSSVISTDSCYFVSGLHGSSPYFAYRSSHFIKFNYDGTINEISIIHNDTLGISFMPQSKMIQTLDGNVAHIAKAALTDAPHSFIFIKQNLQGEILLTKYYPEFYVEDSNIGKTPSTLIQVKDSTYFGLVHVYREDDVVGGIIFFRIDKNGNLMYKENFYGISIETYNTLRSSSFVQINENQFVIGTSYRKDYGSTEDLRHHTKLIVVDSLGEILEEYTYWEDLLSLDCHNLSKTSDNGLLYCGRIGEYTPEYGGVNLYKARIVKLSSDFEEDWEITLGESFKHSATIALNSIKQINETDYVALGYIISTIEEEVNNYGWLVKFNIEGDVIWQRKYLKIPHFGTNHAEHRLYDVDITSDMGFVMVGTAINYYDTEDLPGQKAWLIKVDSFGCLVPGCQDFDLGIAEKESDYQSTPIYPNPATNYIFYYHHQENFQPVDVKIYSTSGQIVQAWSIVSNDITCEVDISDFEEGMYILSVTAEDGEVLETQKFVKE